MTHKMKIKQGSPSELTANIFGIRVKLPLGKLRKDESIKKFLKVASGSLSGR